MKRFTYYSISVCLFVCMGLNRTSGETSPPLPHMTSLPPGEFVIDTNALRLSHVHLRLPEGEVLDYTGKGDPEDKGWQVRFTASNQDPTLWHLILEQQTDVVTRQVEYWLYAPAAKENDMGPMELIFASETAMDTDNDLCLYRSQSLECTLRFGETLNPITLERSAPWIRRNLNRIYDLDILTVFSDYFFHNIADEEEALGYAYSIACNQRCLELDPQAEDLYTLNAWLLWSDWVAWQKDPNNLPNREGHITQALELIKKGRAANPASAAYHLDAAQTVFLIANTYRPDLMDFVIRYYHHAEVLATDRDMRIRIYKSLGHRYRHKGDIETAKHWYREALKLDPEDKVARRHLELLMEPEQEEKDSEQQLPTKHHI